MKPVFAALLIIVGLYSFSLGLYLSMQSLEMGRTQRARQIVYGEDNSAAPVQLGTRKPQRYPVGLFLLCATGTTFGLWGGLHLFFLEKTGRKKSKANRR